MSQTIHNANIVTLARTGLTLDHIKIVYEAIQEINGIGPKIASLFIRDVAVFYNIYPKNDRHLLQPVDVWVNRVFKQLASADRLKTPDTKNIQRWIVESALNAGVRAEAVNEGMWYFSSQIADSDYRMSKALNDIKYARALLQQHMETVSQELSAWEKLAKGPKAAEVINEL